MRVAHSRKHTHVRTHENKKTFAFVFLASLKRNTISIVATSVAASATAAVVAVATYQRDVSIRVHSEWMGIYRIEKIHYIWWMVVLRHTQHLRLIIIIIMFPIDARRYLRAPHLEVFNINAHTL